MARAHPEVNSWDEKLFAVNGMGNGAADLRGQRAEFLANTAWALAQMNSSDEKRKSMKDGAAVLRPQRAEFLARLLFEDGARASRGELVG